MLARLHVANSGNLITKFFFKKKKTSGLIYYCLSILTFMIALENSVEEHEGERFGVAVAV